eukprot:352738-Chlamydomonas_euryale.AAC.7
MFASMLPMQPGSKIQRHACMHACMQDPCVPARWLHTNVLAVAGFPPLKASMVCMGAGRCPA